MTRYVSSQRFVRRRAGFSLMELMVATGVMSLLAVALSSSLYLAQMSIPDNQGLSSSTVKGSQVIERLYSDLEFAQSVTTLSPGEIVFTLADQDGKTPSTETVRYFWSGVPGTALSREFNGRSVVAASNVQEFALEYDRIAEAIPPADAAGSEVELVDADDSRSPDNNVITSSNWLSQYVIPVLSQEVHGWRITRIVVRAKGDDPLTGTTQVQLQAATVGRQPTGQILAQTSLLESSITKHYASTSLSFTGCPTLSPTTGVCLVFKFGADEDCGTFQSWTPSSMPGNVTLLTTSNSGSSWTNSSNVLRFTLYGVVETATGATTYRYRLGSVRSSLRLSSDSRSRLSTRIPILNQPAVTGP